MIVVLVEVETSAEAIEGLRAPLDVMQKASRAEEGCHDYTFSQEICDPNKMRIVEIWESMDALKFHFGTPHMEAFRKAMAASPPGSMTVKVHELGAQLELPS
jgi:quinol monooxygenase YgiN